MDRSGTHSAVLPGPSARKELVIGIATTFLFFFSAMFIPVLGFVAGIFTPLPTLLCYYRWGVPLGYCVPVVVATTGTLILGYLGVGMAAPYLFQFLFMGIALAIGMRRRWSVEWTILVPSLIVYGMGALTLWVVYGENPNGVLKSLEVDLRNAMTMIFQHYGTATQDRRLLEQIFNESVPLLLQLLPGVSLSFTLLVSWLNVMVTRRYCRIHGVPLPFWVEWSRWKAPESLVWPVIASGFLLLLSQGQIRIFAANGLIVLGTIYLFQGLAITSFYMEKWRLPHILRAVIYGILLLQHFATLGIILLGLFDMWLDFRRLTRKASDSL